MCFGGDTFQTGDPEAERQKKEFEEEQRRKALERKMADLAALKVPAARGGTASTLLRPRVEPGAGVSARRMLTGV